MTRYICGSTAQTQPKERGTKTQGIYYYPPSHPTASCPTGANLLRPISVRRNCMQRAIQRSDGPECTGEHGAEDEYGAEGGEVCGAMLSCREVFW